MHIVALPDPSSKDCAAVSYMVWWCLLAVWPLEFLVETMQFTISAKKYVN